MIERGGAAVRKLSDLRVRRGGASSAKGKRNEGSEGSKSGESED